MLDEAVHGVGRSGGCHRCPVDSQVCGVLVCKHVDLALHCHSNPQKLSVQRCSTEQVATLGVGDVEGGKRGFGADLYLVCVKLLQWDCIKVVAFLGVTCMDQSELSNESCDTTKCQHCSKAFYFHFQFQAFLTNWLAGIFNTIGTGTGGGGGGGGHWGHVPPQNCIAAGALFRHSWSSNQ